MLLVFVLFINSNQVCCFAVEDELSEVEIVPLFSLTQTEITFNGLQSNTDYSVRVRAQNNEDDVSFSQFSSKIAFTTCE